MDHMPCLESMKGEGPEHHPETPAQAEAEPAQTRRIKERGIGCAPVPGGQEEKKNRRAEGCGFPNEQVEKREEEVEGKKTSQEGEP